MIKIKIFQFNAFGENTFVLYDESKACCVVDPGMNKPVEQKVLSNFLSEKALKPLFMLNTHCHIDHVLGNAFLREKYGLKLYAPPHEDEVLAHLPAQAMLFGQQATPSPQIDVLVRHGEKIRFANSELEVRHIGGHSPGSSIYVAHNENFIIAGDVLFHQSIGRTDLPGGNHNQLIEGIEKQIFSLPDHYVVFPGHGQKTTVGHEKRNNPFF